MMKITAEGSSPTLYYTSKDLQPEVWPLGANRKIEDDGTLRREDEFPLLINLFSCVMSDDTLRMMLPFIFHMYTLFRLTDFVSEVSEVVVLATAFVTFLSTAAASTCCAYVCRRIGEQNTTEKLKERKGILVDLIDALKQKEKAGAVITPELPKFIVDVDAILAHMSDYIANFKGDEKCVCGLLPNLWAQKKVRTQMDRELSKLDYWIVKAEAMDALPVRGYKQMGEDEVVIVGNERREAAEKIWKLATSGDQELGTICIHGAFGVGKTTIAKYVYERALLEKDPAFDSFIWVTVEHEAGIWKVQEDIAKILKIELSKRVGGTDAVETAPTDTADTVERAAILNKALLQKGNFLLVLDSIWQPLSLHDIGIPEPVGGRKLIVTSRKLTVCDEIMRFTEMIEIQPLPSFNEAWDLFHTEMGSLQGLAWENIARIKRALLEELDGLPLAIKKLARTLGNIQKQKTADLNRVWRTELAYLVDKPIYQEGRDTELFDRFKNSYKNLKEHTRCCFQYCALFPKNHVIESKELIEYWMWEGLLGDFDTLEEGMEKGTKALRELKNAHLLESGSDHEKVKLLSLVRSMAIDTMVIEQKPVCTRPGGSLTSLPPSGPYWNSNVQRASFMQNNLEVLDLKEKLDCSELCTLLLQDNPLVSVSSRAFFSSMCKLKVLDLSRTNISTLPHSLSNLMQLRALLLRSCPNLTNLPSLSTLLELIVLDLSGTPLENCPDGMENMKKLRRLDLSGTRLATFPAYVVGKLIELEELLMITDHNCVWGLREDSQQQGACIEDLLKLRKLAVLQLHFQSAKAFHKYINKVEMGINVPSKFLFYVGEVEHGGYVEQNNLTINGSHRGTTAISEQELIVRSLRKLRDLNVLDVSNLSNLSYLFSVDILGSFTQLRELCVRSCEELVEVVRLPAAYNRHISLPHLTKMVFFDLPKLKNVCCGTEVDCPVLGSIEVWRCDNLKLPMISTASTREIHIRGEESWVGSLEWDNPGNKNRHFQSHPHVLSNLKLDQYLGSCFVKMGTQMSINEKGQHILREVTVRGCKQLAEVAIVGRSGTEVKEEIWKLVSMASWEPGAICIHGTFGVGKTTIAVAIHNRALVEPTLFDSVIWVNLKYNGDLLQVQEDIARSLKIDMSDIPGTGATVERAQRLRDALLRTRKFLLVLDSMWQPFSLQDIGIPELVNGQKLIVTSRIRNVCKRIRGKVFELIPLPENEAWELFKYELGFSLSHLNGETLKNTQSAVADLDGLPLAISCLARTLSAIQEEDSAELNREWMEQLAELARKPIYLQPKDQELFNRFKHSYENLKVATRSCFVYSALFPKRHDIESKELIEHWMWEGLLGENINTLEEGMEKGRARLEELKNANLLQSVAGESVRSDERVKLLSLVRSMAFDTMVDEERRRFFIRSGCSLTNLPREHEWPPEVEIASFMHNQLIALKLGGKLNCTQLSTLLLQNNSLTESFSDENFFYNMPSLRVLDLSRTLISFLPNSFSRLRNLHALLLRDCPKLKILPNLSNLQQLVVLDLSGTPLEHCPEGIQKMRKLRRLDLSQTKLAIFPAKVVDKLIELEELLMITDENRGYEWGSNELEKQWKGASIEELLVLQKLSVLQMKFLNAKVFNLYVNKAEMYAGVPPKFQFCVGGFQNSGYVGHNSITVSGSHSVTLPNRTSKLHLQMCGEKTRLLNLEGCLRDLNVLDVSNFSGLSYLFSVEILGSLKNLRQLSVRRCKKMMEVVRPAAEDNPTKIYHPGLTTMIFFDLPTLQSVCCGQVLDCPYLCSVQVWGCDKLKLPMILSANRRKIEIRGQRSWLQNLSWDNPGNSNSLFQDTPQLNSNLKLVEAPLPPELEATARAQNDNPQEEGSSSVVPEVHQTNGTNITRWLNPFSLLLRG